MTPMEDGSYNIPTLAAELATILADVRRLLDGDIAESELLQLVQIDDDSIHANTLQVALTYAQNAWDGQQEEAIEHCTGPAGESRWRAPPVLAAKRAGLQVHPLVIMLLQVRFAAAVDSENTDQLAAVIDQLSTAASTHHSAAVAAALIGAQLLDAEIEGGALLFMLVMEQGDDDLAALAAAHLIRFYYGQGEHGQAADIAYTAAKSRYVDRMLGGKLQLGMLLHQAERRDAAFEILREVAAGTGSDSATATRLLLSDPSSAEAAYRTGLQLETEGDAAAACESYLVCAQTPDSPFAAQSAFNLGRLAEDIGDHDLALEGWQLAADSGHPEHAPAAAHSLALILQSAGDTAGACQYLQQAIKRGSPTVAAKAGFLFGHLLWQQNCIPEAIAAFREVRTHPTSEVFGAASYHLSRMLMGDDPNAAEVLLRDAVATGDIHVITMFQEALASCLQQDSQSHAAAPTAAIAVSRLFEGHPDEFGERIQLASDEAIGNVLLLLTAYSHINIDTVLEGCMAAIRTGRPAPARFAAYLIGRTLRTEQDIPTSREALTQSLHHDDYPGSSDVC